MQRLVYRIGSTRIDCRCTLDRNFGRGRRRAVVWNSGSTTNAIPNCTSKIGGDYRWMRPAMERTRQHRHRLARSRRRVFQENLPADWQWIRWVS